MEKNENVEMMEKNPLMDEILASRRQLAHDRRKFAEHEQSDLSVKRKTNKDKFHEQVNIAVSKIFKKYF